MAERSESFYLDLGAKNEIFYNWEVGAERRLASEEVLTVLL